MRQNEWRRIDAAWIYVTKRGDVHFAKLYTVTFLIKFVMFDNHIMTAQAIQGNCHVQLKIAPPIC